MDEKSKKHAIWVMEEMISALDSSELFKQSWIDHMQAEIEIAINAINAEK